MNKYLWSEKRKLKNSTKKEKDKIRKERTKHNLNQPHLSQYIKLGNMKKDIKISYLTKPNGNNWKYKYVKTSSIKI